MVAQAEEATLARATVVVCNLTIAGGGPAHGVGYDALYIGVMIGWQRFVTRAEVEDTPLTSGVAAATAKYFAARKPAHQHQRIGLGNIKTLTIHLFSLNFD